MKPLDEIQRSCSLGCTESELEEIFDTPQEYAAFCAWIVGQTGAICTGFKFDHDTRKYSASPCGEAYGRGHGAVTYAHDVERYVSSGAVARQ